ncbi:MAG: nucleotidyltransferase family protein [Dehalococcoidia bacterium]|nr:nucleotidyltransferase family protein [Dehalococcoidia bacterium]
MKAEDILAILAAHRAEIKDFGVKSLALFGSAARGEAGPESDVDLLVEFDRLVGLFEFIEVKEYLEGLLGRPVDLVTPDALRPTMREGILSEAVYAS